MITSDKLFLGMDIGASSVKYGYGNCKQDLLHFSKVPLTERSLIGLRKAVTEILQDVDARLGLNQIAAIGVGTPGMVDAQSGKLKGVNPNLPFWVDRDPRDLFSDDLGIPIFYDNDANLMVLGEAWLRPDMSSVFGVTLGSGIGGGLVRDNVIYHGSHGYAMEVGHIMVVHQGCLCACGRLGCLEAYSGVDGLKKRIASLTGDPGVLSWELRVMLDKAVRNSLISKVIDEGRSHLARALANIIVVLDPDCVVLGGGALEAGLYDADILREMIVSLLPHPHCVITCVEAALRGNRAGVLGAIVLASQKLSLSTERNLLQ
jgi:glucokinase